VTPDASLLSDEGQELLAWLSGRDVSPDQALRLAEELRGRYPASLVAAALTQQALRTAGRAKFSLADSMLLTRAGLEQASSDLTAGHSARRFAAFGLVADLCCGIGGNLAALAGAAEHVLAVDRDPTALLFAMRNALVHGVAGKVTPLCADVRDLVLPAVGGPGPTVGSGRRVGGIFIDPARRTGDRRLRAGASEPPLAWCFALADRVPAVGIKAAPGLPHELVPPGWETEFVAVARNLKEALVWSPALATSMVASTARPGCRTWRVSTGS
jgi:SAM-dependent methyltransferase